MMDLSKLNPTAASDTSKRFDLVDPFTGEPVGDENGEVLGYSVVGVHGTVARNEDARIRRERPRRPHSDVDEADMNDEQRSELTEYTETLQAYYAESGARKLAAMVTELHGSWSNGDKKLKASGKKQLAEMLEQQDWIANQIANNAATLANYRPEM